MVGNTYKEFDYYQTNLDFIDSNNDEKYLELYNYGLKKKTSITIKKKLRKQGKNTKTSILELVIGAQFLYGL